VENSQETQEGEGQEHSDQDESSSHSSYDPGSDMSAGSDDVSIPATQTFKVPTCAFKTLYQAHQYFAVEQITVYCTVVEQQCAAGVKLKWCVQETCNRLLFYFKYVIWYANTVIIQQSRRKWPSNSAVTVGAIKSALNVIKQYSAEELLDMYMTFMFHQKQAAGDVVGFYAKDGELIGQATDLMKFVFESCDGVRSISHHDMFLHFRVHHGMSMGKAWVYSGGTCNAGHHVEDGFLHFVHMMLAIDMQHTQYSLGVLAPHVCTDGEVVRDVLLTIQAIALKRWLMGRAATSRHNVLTVNDIIRPARIWVGDS